MKTLGPISPGEGCTLATEPNAKVRSLPEPAVSMRRRFLSRREAVAKRLRIFYKDIAKFRTVLKVRKEDPPFTTGNQFRATILNSPLNTMLLAVPAGFAVKFLNINPIAVFFVNFVASFPLSSILGNAVDDLTKHIGGLLGMLVYMTFG
jgi:hypothetical protein